MGRAAGSTTTRRPLAAPVGLLAMAAMLLLLLLQLLAPVLGAGSTATADARLAEMAKLHRRKQSHGVVPVDDGTFDHYALDKPRPYHLMVLFTALSERYNCRICREVELEFDVTAQNYWRLHPKPEESTLFFLRLDYDQSPNTFRAYGLTGVPAMIHLSPALGVAAAGKKNGTEAYQVEARDRFPMHSSNIDAEQIAKFVGQRCGVEISIYKSPMPVIMFMLFLLAALAFSAKHLINLIPWALQKAQNKYLWMAVSAVCFTCSVSGLIFDIIRSPPPFGVDRRTGVATFFHPQSGQQYVVEGFIIGGYNIICSLAAILLVEFSAPGRIKNEQYRKAAMITCLVLFPLFFYQVFWHYRQKNRWYFRV